MSDKIFRTYTEQRELLETRGLIINHPRSFTSSMQRDDYYNIINGYKKYFIASMNPERYIQGTTFEQIYTLYSFDQTMRAYFLTEFIKIEKHIKALVAYHFSEAHGYDHRQYLDIACFRNNSRKNRQFATKTIQKMLDTIKYYQYKGTNAICHYMQTYGYVPLWVLNNVASFGQIARFYRCMALSEQTAIAKHFKISPRQLDGFIYFLSDIRNTCAHGSRIYTTNTAVKYQKLIPDTPVHKQLGIYQNTTGNYIIGKTDVLAILITLKYFSKKSDFSILKKRLRKCYNTMKNIIPEPILANIHREMGCPMDYLSKL